MKKKIKLTEQDIHKIVKQTLKNVLNESDIYDYDANYEELIKNECHNLYELEAKVPYAYRSDIHSALTTLESILYSKKIGNMISEI